MLPPKVTKPHIYHRKNKQTNKQISKQNQQIKQTKLPEIHKKTPQPQPQIKEKEGRGLITQIPQTSKYK